MTHTFVVFQGIFLVLILPLPHVSSFESVLPLLVVEDGVYIANYQYVFIRLLSLPSNYKSFLFKTFDLFLYSVIAHIYRFTNGGIAWIAWMRFSMLAIHKVRIYDYFVCEKSKTENPLLSTY